MFKAEVYYGDRNADWWLYPPSVNLIGGEH